jgi:hypothetical protein
VKQFSVDFGLNIPEDFEFHLDETSDEYRYLFQQPITPFVNSQGEEVNVLQIISKRKSLLETDSETFTNNAKVVQIGAKRRKKFNNDWNSYRTFDSELLLPFKKDNGFTVTIQAMQASRVTLEKFRNPKLSIRRPEVFSELHALRRQKQLAEHNLMTFKEEQTEKRVGKMVLTQFNILLANKKRDLSEKEEEDKREKDRKEAERVTKESPAEKVGRACIAHKRAPYRGLEVEQEKEKENGATSDGGMELRPGETVAR